MMLFGATKNCSIQPLAVCGIGEIFRAMGPLVLIGLGFAVASRAGFFNVGLPGQALAGWILSGWFAVASRYAPSLDDSSNHRDCLDCWWDCRSDSRYS